MLSVAFPSSLLAPSPGEVWAASLVERGRAQLFATVDSGDGPGPRWPLFDVTEGELILPPPPGSGVVVIAVGIEDGTSAQPTDVATLRRLVELGLKTK